MGGHTRRSLLTKLPIGLAGLAASSPLWARLLSQATAQERTQQRLIVWYTPDGTVPEWFWPSAPGALSIRSDRTEDLTGVDFSTAIPEADRPTFLLQPLAPYADRMTMVRGIHNMGENNHGPAVHALLTGERATEADPGYSPSLDAIVGEALALPTHAEPVLRTGTFGDLVSYRETRELCRPRDRSFVEPSWQPVADARRVLDVVGGAMIDPSAQSARKASRLAVLGSVRDRVEQLRCAAGTPAANRLEAYVAEVDRLSRLENEMRGGASTGPLVSANDPAATAAQRDIASYQAIAPFVRDLSVTALALEYAPVVTIQWGASGDNNIESGQLTDRRYDFLPGFEAFGAGDHGLAHPEDVAFTDAGHRITAEGSTRDRVRVKRWFATQLRALLDRLSSTPAEGGTLLDSTTILCVSEFGGPNANSTDAQHSTRDLPFMLIGGSNTPWRKGRYLTTDREHGDFLLTVARALGSSVDRVGAGARTIEGIV